MIPWKEREEKEKSVRKSETDMTMSLFGSQVWRFLTLSSASVTLRE
jgi:hypothetical protein